MKFLTYLLLAVTILLAASRATAKEPMEELAPLAPFIGTWRSVSGSVDGSDTFTDVSKWEWILGGRVVRITHSVNDGAYAGESLIHWDGQQGKIIYRYVNNADFFTDGIITPTEDGISVHEYVRGASSGPTETKSFYGIRDGQIHAWSQFLTDGEWSDKSDVVYDPAPDAVVTLP